MSVKTKILICLVIIGIIDMMIPIPILGIVLFYVVFQKPTWFRQIVDEVYQ